MHATRVLEAKPKTMEATKILQADMLDILFEGRNKLYGAYDLRKNYNKRIRNALIITGALTLLFTTGILLASRHHSLTAGTLYVKDYTLSNFAEDKLKPVPVQPQSKPKPVQVKTIAFTPPRIVEQIDKTEVPTEETLDNTKIAAVTNDKGTDGDIVAPPQDISTGSDVKLPVKQVGETSFSLVQIEAKFPGGLDAWKDYLERNLRTEVPVENGAPAGQYTVIVSFLVDENGNVSDIKAENDPGYGTAAEATRVIKKSKQWIPAIQNGRNVEYRQRQSITFVVTAG